MAIAIWDGKDQAEMLQYFTGYGIPKDAEYYRQVRQIAARYVMDSGNPARKRYDVLVLYCLANDIPEYKEARKCIPEILEAIKPQFDFRKNDYGIVRCMSRNFQMGDYSLVAEIGNHFVDFNLFNNVK